MGGREGDGSLLVKVVTFDLGDGEMFRVVQEDYEIIRAALKQRGVRGLIGSLGKLVQARTKGTGGRSTTRAFYARGSFVARMLGLE